nr:hypothetical protein [Mycobacterium sp. 852002-51163_SCH5372311]
MIKPINPYRQSKLRDAYQKALSSNDVDFVWITGFQPCQALLDTPTPWVVSQLRPHSQRAAEQSAAAVQASTGGVKVQLSLSADTLSK